MAHCLVIGSAASGRSLAVELRARARAAFL